MSVQLQCIQLIIQIKTNEADLSSDVFAISICFTYSCSIVINKQAMEANLVLFIVIWSVSKSLGVALRSMIRRIL